MGDHADDLMWEEIRSGILREDDGFEDDGPDQDEFDFEFED
jgi:hypothetical protein